MEIIGFWQEKKGSWGRKIPSDDADCEAPEARHVFRTVAGAYPTAVLIIVPVDNVVTALDAPMKPVGSQNTLSVCLLRRSTGDTVSNLFRVFARFFVNGLSLNGKSLSDMWEIEILCNSDKEILAIKIQYNSVMSRIIQTNLNLNI
jgi:hypothetical protein